MSTRDNIADILCIGCQKGSTSWLHSVLNCHPRTWAFPDSEPLTSTCKEAHFWDWNHERGVEWYRTLMTPPEPEPNRVTMDFTPEYAFLSDTQIAECKALNPTAKVVYILRDPMVRAVSAIRMHMLWHYGKDHKEPLTLGERFEAFCRDARLTQHGDYLRNAAAWRKQYPDLILLNYEDFHTDRTDSLSRIFDAFGLDPTEITGDARKRMTQLMSGRVWASEPFDMDRSVLMFLQGLTWATRELTESELGMRFAEGAQMLKD